MMISMNVDSNKKVRPGVALLVVLFIVMAITILSLGFVSRSDVELACGRNMLLRTQMDYLAESGLEHARGLILNLQDVSAEYWTGGTGLQLVSGNNDYYDVTVNRDPNDHCNYNVDCDAYRLDGTEKIGLSRLRAELRLDPCIACWAGSNTTVWSQMTINGDFYCGGTLTNNGVIEGDAFAVGTIAGTGAITGRQNESVAPAYPVAWPGITVADFVPTYYIVDGNVPASPLTGVCYGADDVNMLGNATINGTLVVGGDLTVSGLNNVITAEKNFPALFVGGQVLMKDGGSLVVNGLAQIGGPVTADPSPTIKPQIDVIGGLFIAGSGVTSDKVIVNVTAAAEIASIEIWPAPGASKRWGPAAGAFFRSVERR
jgi:hypothetical protein